MYFLFVLSFFLMCFSEEEGHQRMWICVRLFLIWEVMFRWLLLSSWIRGLEAVVRFFFFFLNPTITTRNKHDSLHLTDFEGYINNLLLRFHKLEWLTEITYKNGQNQDSRDWVFPNINTLTSQIQITDKVLSRQTSADLLHLQCVGVVLSDVIDSGLERSRRNCHENWFKCC